MFAWCDSGLVQKSQEMCWSHSCLRLPVTVNIFMILLLSTALTIYNVQLKTMFILHFIMSIFYGCLLVLEFTSSVLA